MAVGDDERDAEIAKAIRAQLTWLLAQQGRSTTIELLVDGQTLRKVRRPARPDPTPRLARRARAKKKENA